MSLCYELTVLLNRANPLKAAHSSTSPMGPGSLPLLVLLLLQEWRNGSRKRAREREREIDRKTTYTYIYIYILLYSSPYIIYSNTVVCMFFTSNQSAGGASTLSKAPDDAGAASAAPTARAAGAQRRCGDSGLLGATLLQGPKESGPLVPSLLG